MGNHLVNIVIISVPLWTCRVSPKATHIELVKVSRSHGVQMRRTTTASLKSHLWPLCTSDFHRLPSICVHKAALFHHVFDKHRGNVLVWSGDGQVPLFLLRNLLYQVEE